MAKRPIYFIVPGPIAQRTGGYGYDRRIVESLRAAGRIVETVELDGSYPFCCEIARDSAAKAQAKIPDGAIAVIDGLALPAFDRSLSRLAGRTKTVALIHHSLALETGLSEYQQHKLGMIEGALIAQMDGVVVTSRATAEILSDQGHSNSLISVVLPGTDPAPRAEGSAGVDVQLLCVGTLIPRKGHGVLVDALAECTALSWRLLCLGSLERDIATVVAVREQLAAHRLRCRIELAGEACENNLADAYDSADVFVLASAFEGYGMAFAEALARGLPVVGSGDGAVRDTVPESAGVIVPVGDRAALTEALRQIISDRRLRRTLAEGAYAAGQQLPNWTAAGRSFAAALDLLAVE